ncbi:hypothetical protein Pryu01_02306 [Paraliobacillus ryukyuensis]|uniref:Fur-regulated basic protein B n=1 Tax=Paraliobacillus ryukyuensis TaxID=200904 RepID=A0A366DWU0_9BACI|nr:FbpB family small basic protein [Paraliobacillus ryukyuensis]RBO94522.1 Fur-regulated basic protein B [Paraliobacillus ryukyuensis]
MRLKKYSFEQLVNQNKKELLDDSDTMKKLEERIDNKYMNKNNNK